MKRCLFAITLLSLYSVAALRADDLASTAPKPVPETRPDIKVALEELKEREPRLPMPPDEEDRGGANNGRMRAYYLPESWGGGGRGGNRARGDRRRRPWQDPNALLDYPFATSCFWIVSRGNNCHYCLGHQELKLRSAGLDDDTIAALDSDWSRFDPKMQAALGYARKLTLEPHLVGDDDITALNEVMTEPEIVELTFVISRFNSTNRWTDGLGIPQDERFRDDGGSLVTPTSAAYQRTKSIVAPFTRAPRPAAPTHAELMDAIADCRSREARVTIPAADDSSESHLWERALSQLPENGPANVRAWNTIMSDDHLSPRLKTELALIAAAHNRAWYAAGHAVHQLRELGASPAEIADLLSGHESADATAASAYRLAAKLTADPHLITDDDIAQVRRGFTDHETAQIVHVICMANLFDRFTEALGLPLEQEIAAD